jgi:hypothetical protein
MFLPHTCLHYKDQPINYVQGNNRFKARLQNCVKRLLDSSRLSVRPSIRMQQLASHWTDFHEI